VEIVDKQLFVLLDGGGQVRHLTVIVQEPTAWISKI